MRVAATGDIHLGLDSAGQLRSRLGHLAEQAEILLLAGDLTRLGDPREAEVVAAELVDVELPVAAVLGNHDYHSNEQDRVASVLEEVGVRVLEGTSAVFDLPSGRLGVAGVKGFGSGFPPASASEFGEPEMKAFVSHGRQAADRLEKALNELDTEVRVALSHYSPAVGTLEGELPEIHAFLGSSSLGEAIDRAGATIAIHGHAHKGRPAATTPGGVPVRNVAQPVIEKAYCVFDLDVLDRRAAAR